MTDRTGSTDMPGRKSPAAWMEQHQVVLYLLAILGGAVLGLLVPQLADPAETLVNPVLALLLYATFLAVPLVDKGRRGFPVRFTVTVLVLNFVLVPLVVWVVTRPLAGSDDPGHSALLVGALFVLLAPCIDYVIVFTGLAGGAGDRLLATTPLLMLAQILLLPVYLRVFVGAETAGAVDVTPFIEAFVLLILLPLAAAALTQFLAGNGGNGDGALRSAAKAVERGVSAAMVPLMMLTLAVVVASQITRVSEQWSSLTRVVPVYVVFAVVMTGVGLAVGRVARLDVPERRAVVFTGVTRNSLVVLPLVLALPAQFALAPAAVVTQTLVELIVMVILVRALPVLLPDRAGRG